MKKYLCHITINRNVVQFFGDRQNLFVFSRPSSFIFSLFYTDTLSDISKFGYPATTTYLYINTKKLCAVASGFFIQQMRTHLINSYSFNIAGRPNSYAIGQFGNHCEIDVSLCPLSIVLGSMDNIVEFVNKFAIDAVINHINHFLGASCECH